MLIKLVVKIYSLNLASAYRGYTLIVFMTQGYLAAKRLRTTAIKRLRSLHVVFLKRSLQNLVALKIPKQPKSSTAKVRQICSEYPDEFLATPVGDLRCNLCDVLAEVGSTVYKSTAVLRLILGSLKVFFASIATCFCFSYRLPLQSTFLIYSSIITN